MNSIQKDNLFVLPVGEKGDWIRYHPLFLEFLQARVYMDFPVKSKKIEHELALYCIQRNEWDRAYAILNKLNADEDLISLIEIAGPQMLFDGKIALVSSWIEALGPELINSHPFIVALQGYIAMILGDKSYAMTLYDQAIDALGSGSNNEYLARTLAMRANNHRLVGNLDAAISDANESNKLIMSNLNLRKIKGDVLRCIGLCNLHKGKLQEALNWLEKAQKVMLSAGDKKNEAIIQMEIGLVHENLGNYIASKDWYIKALIYWEQIENPFWLANLLNNLGVLYQLMGDYENAILSFDRALNYAQATKYTRMEAFIFTGIADIFVELQALEQAQIGYDKALKLATRFTGTFFAGLYSCTKGFIIRPNWKFG